MFKDEWPKEKKWEKVYTRSEKLHRAKQLGFEYPILTEKKLLDAAATNVLFVCSKNQWRSPTAEKIYSEHPLLNVKSGGTASSARHSVNAADIKWADLIIVMEDKHKSHLVTKFPGDLRYKQIYILDIPDEYRFMDPQLIEELRIAVDPLLFAKNST
jgi:predicted protein tyrosine phosphatase